MFQTTNQSVCFHNCWKFVFLKLGVWSCCFWSVGFVLWLKLIDATTRFVGYHDWPMDSGVPWYSVLRQTPRLGSGVCGTKYGYYAHFEICNQWWSDNLRRQKPEFMNPKWFHHPIGKKTFAGVKERRYGLISSEMIYRWWIPQPTRQLFWARPRTPPWKPHIGTHLDVFKTKEGWDEVLPDCPISSLWYSI